MQLDVNLIIQEYEKLLQEYQRKFILLKVENDMLKKQLEDKGKEDK
jgi:hypothetical protein